MFLFGKPQLCSFKKLNNWKFPAATKPNQTIKTSLVDKSGLESKIRVWFKTFLSFSEEEHKTTAWHVTIRVPHHK